MFDFILSVEHFDKIGAWEIDTLSQEVVWSRGMYLLQGSAPNSFAPNLRIMRQHFPKLASLLFAWSLQPDSPETKHLTFRTKLERCDGITREVVVSATPRVRNSILQRVGGFVNEVTSETFNQVRAIEAEQRYLLLFQYAPHGLIQAGADKRIILANPALCRMLDYTSDQLCKMTTNDITHRDDREISAEAVRMLWMGELEHCSYEKRYVRRDGSAVLVQLGLSLLRDAAGKPLNFIGQCVPLPEPQVGELEERQQNLALLKAQNKLLLASAKIDALTKLQNRASFQAALESASRVRQDPSDLGTISVEVRSLHLLNRNYGNEAVDDLLVQVGQILVKSQLKCLCVARLQGGCFRLLLQHTTEKRIHAAAQEIRLCLERITWAGNKVTAKVTCEMLSKASRPVATVSYQNLLSSESVRSVLTIS